MTRVALYLRQSKDSEGDGLAIDRQRENCEKLAATQGWVIDERRVYIDNNISASAMRPRPAYQRMIADIRRGLIDVVITWNLDRLTRRPREIEDWIDLHESHGVNLLTSEQKDRIDLSTEGGRLVLRIIASVARQEVERKGRRQKESNAQARSLGLPPNGRRAFGYTTLRPDAKSTRETRLGADGREYPAYGHEPVAAEADAIRRGYDLLLAGASLRSIAREWNNSGHATTSGADWTSHTVRGVLANPRYAGFVALPRSAESASHTASRHDMSTLTAGTWEPIVSAETWSAANETLRDPGRRKTGSAPRRWLLSGLATCGIVADDGSVCGAPMKAGATRDRMPTYRCSASYHLARKADVVDELVSAAVIERLSRADAAELLTNHEAPDLDALRSELLAAQSRLANVASLVADGTLTGDQARDAVARLRATISSLETRMSDAGRVDVLGPLVSGADVRAVWEELPTELQRRVIATLMNVEMRSPGRGTRAPAGEDGRLAHTARSVAIAWR